MLIRNFKTSDTPALVDLFRKTVHTVCRADYTPEQLAVWAPENIDSDKWTKRFQNSFTLIAEDKNQISGFANLGADGYIDMFYVAASNQRNGVGTLLFNAIEREARIQGARRLHSDVSLTARAFFQSKGLVIQKEYSKIVGNVTFLNAIMEKTLS